MFTSYTDYRNCHASPVRDARLPSDPGWFPGLTAHRSPSLRSIRAAHNGSALLGTSGKVSQVRSFLRPVDRPAPGWGRRILYGNVPACTRRARAFRQNRVCGFDQMGFRLKTDCRAHIMRPWAGDIRPCTDARRLRPYHFPEASWSLYGAQLETHGSVWNKLSCPLGHND